MTYCTELRCLFKAIDFSNVPLYGYILADILMFIAGIGLLRRTKSTSTILFVYGIGLTMLSDMFQLIAYGPYPIALGDHFSSMVSNEFGFDGVTLMMLIGMLGMVTSGIGIVTYVYSKKMPIQDA